MGFSEQMVDAFVRGDMKTAERLRAKLSPAEQEAVIQQALCELTDRTVKDIDEQ